MSSAKDEIKARLDIVDYISRYVPLKKSGRTYKACCPFHSEKTPSFHVNPENQTWRCFGACADGGDVFSFAMKQNGWSFTEAVEALGQDVGVEVRKQSPLERQKGEREEKLRDLVNTAADFYQQNLFKPEAAHVLQYAREKRGFTEATIRAFGIGYAPEGWQTLLDDLTALGYAQEDVIEAGMAIKNDKGRVYDRFRNRLMIPIRDERGRVIGFGARALNPEDNPKYLNSPQTPLFDKSKVLFGLDVAKNAIRETETVVIVEGYMDAIQAHQAGFTNVVAQMGTAMTEAQLKKIAPRYAKKVILALDADAAGQNATRRSLETARQTLEQDFAGRLSVEFRVLQIPGAKDPDDLIREAPEQWESLVAGALPVADYVIEMEASALPANASIQEREAVARRVLPILIASESQLYRQDNVQKLALRLHISEDVMLRWAQEQKPTSSAPAYVPASPVDEPPPLDLDAVAPPPEGEEDDDLFIDYPVGFSMDAAPESVLDSAAFLPENELERYSLRLLCLYPEAYHQVNRKLRELGMDEKDEVQAAGLHGLQPEDFTHLHYRDIAQCFFEATSQYRMDVLDYMRQQLHGVQAVLLEKLLIHEVQMVQVQLGERMSADLADLLDKQKRRSRSNESVITEMLTKMLELRRQRLKREIDELRFVLMEEEMPEMSLYRRQVALTQAKKRLELELSHQQSRQLM
ncbi:MAG: hypothetical protein OHK0046_28590 [Anaerolineae bacterium]